MEPVHGDPHAIRHQAFVLRAAAESVSSLVRRLDHQVGTVDFHGPAATRFRASMAERTHRGARVATDLDDLADQLVQAAARAEDHAARNPHTGS
jgi:uncharacterized protein YukE